MSKVKKIQKTTAAAQLELERQRAEGTHNPAAPCGTCGTWRTPGITHAPPGKATATCAN